ncbi:MAG TPA: 50S ribosomal protein L25/general stress protein Ctc [Gammaproteobacteria bacterium]|nr:50S ribosomal protein L25/general stress protein Ctc [Gammaproteobacteria bacterium]
MADKFELSAEIREQAGKGASRRLRRVDNKVPAIIYGAGKEPKSITILHHHFNNALKNQAFYSHILTLNIGNSHEKVVLKDLQRHPSKPQILHADFLRVSATEKLHMHVPLRFVNEDTAPGVKLDGGQISHLLNEVEIRCLPSDLPEFIEVDLAELKIDESIHLSELKTPKGVELIALLHNDDRPVVNIHRPHVVEEPETVVAPPAEVPLVGKEEEKPEEGEA